MASSCAYTAQGELVCSKPTTNHAHDTRGMARFQTSTETFASGTSMQVSSCPTNPAERPDCSTQCSLLKRNGDCAHHSDPASLAFRMCSMCLQGCCKEHGVPAQSKLMSVMFPKSG